jgi:hypothetical protein
MRIGTQGLPIPFQIFLPPHTWRAGSTHSPRTNRWGDYCCASRAHSPALAASGRGTAILPLIDLLTNGEAISDNRGRVKVGVGGGWAPPPPPPFTLPPIGLAEEEHRCALRSPDSIRAQWRHSCQQGIVVDTIDGPLLRFCDTHVQQRIHKAITSIV